MAGVDVSKEIKGRFFKAYLQAHQSGNPRQEEQDAIEHFANSGWRWNDFEKWSAIFSDRGEWPYMWLRYPEIYEEPKTTPKTMDEALKYLTVAYMRKFLKDQNIMPKPAPKKREEFEKIIKESFSLENVLPNIKGKIAAQRSFDAQRREEGKCKLLAHTLSMTVYSLRDYYGCKELKDYDSKYRLKAYDSNGTCKIEDEFARKFNKGELDTIPPFFPGDRTGLTCKRNRK